MNSLTNTREKIIERFVYSIMSRTLDHENSLNSNETINGLFYFGMKFEDAVKNLMARFIILSCPRSRNNCANFVHWIIPLISLPRSKVMSVPL